MKNKRWLWFFLVVIVLGLAAVSSLIAFNWSRQLKPDELAAARLHWGQRGPRSYQLTYVIKIGLDEQATSYVVRVRDGRVVSASVNGLPEKRQRFGYYGMEALFDYMGDFLENDAKLRRRIYIHGVFDPQTGALREFVRRVMGGNERVKIAAEPLVPLEEPAPGS